MIRKKLICLVLTMLTLMSCAPLTAFGSNEEYISLTLTMASNLSSKSSITGIYNEGLFYITVQDLCDIIDGEVESQTAKEVVLYNRSKSRQFIIPVGSGEMKETLHSTNFATALPSFYYKDQVYISAVHFLEYIGADILFREDSSEQLGIFVPYDIYDAVHEISTTNAGYWFDLEEVYDNALFMDVSLVEAGVISLITGNSNPFYLMFDTDKIAQEHVEKAFLTILQNEGQNISQDSSSASELFGNLGTTLSSGSFFLEVVGSAYEEAEPILGDFDTFLKGVDLSGGILSNVGAVVDAYSGYLRVENVASTQKNILRKSILQYNGDDPLESARYWKVIREAAKSVDSELQSNASAWSGATADSLKNAGYEYIYALLGNGNPVSLAWDGVLSVFKLTESDRIEDLNNTHHGYNCYMIQLAANHMANSTYSDWYFSNAKNTDPQQQMEMLDNIKHSLILQLKSTITSRDYFVAGNKLSVEAAQEANGDIAGLLRRLEGCRITGPGLEEIPDLEKIQAVLERIVDGNTSPENSTSTPALTPVTLEELPSPDSFEKRLWNVAGREYDSAKPEDQSYALAWAMSPYGLWPDAPYEGFQEDGSSSFTGFIESFFGEGHYSNATVDDLFYDPGYNGYAFATWDKETIDMLAETVLNCSTQSVPTVSHNREDSPDSPVILCQDGKYYTAWAEAGFIPPEIQIAALFTDGTDYYVMYDWIEGWQEGSWETAARQYAILKPKELDGKTIWSVIAASPNPLFQSPTGG